MIYYSSRNTEDKNIRIFVASMKIRQNSFSEVFVSTEQEHSSPWTIDEIPILGPAFSW